MSADLERIAVHIFYQPPSYDEPLNNHKVETGSFSAQLKERVSLAVSSVFTQLKEQFFLIEKWISFNFQGQIPETSSASIDDLQKQSKFTFTITGQNHEPKDIEALKKVFLKASISEDPTSIFVDRNGKLCGMEKSAVEFICSKNKCEAMKGIVRSNLTLNHIALIEELSISNFAELENRYIMYTTAGGNDFSIRDANEKEILHIQINEKK